MSGLDAFRDKRIFMTGGTGFFGKWLLNHFQGLEVDVIVLSRTPATFLSEFPMFGRNPNVTFIQGDVRDFSFPSGHFDYVIHAATEASVKLDQENPEEMVSVIVDGTKRVLEFSKQAGIHRFLYVSSGAVYGVQPPELSHIPETFPCNPVSAYGKGKLMAERLCLESGVETVIARPFAFVGPWLPLNEHFAIGNFIGNCLRNEPIEIKGDGTPLRSYMYGADLADWLLKILLRGRVNEIYNVGSQDAVSILETARLVRTAAGVFNEIRVLQARNGRRLPERYIPSVGKAMMEIGLRSRYTLPFALEQTFLKLRGFNNEVLSIRSDI